MAIVLDDRVSGSGPNAKIDPSLFADDSIDKSKLTNATGGALDDAVSLQRTTSDSTGITLVSQAGASKKLVVSGGGTGGTGLGQEAVDARVEAGVQQPFRTGEDMSDLDALGSSDASSGDTAFIEDSGTYKKMSLGQFAAFIQNETVVDWAQVSNDDDIPGTKLGNAPNQAADFAKRTGASGTIPLERAGSGSATAGKILKVNAGGTALEYVDEGAGNTTSQELEALASLPGTSGYTLGDIVNVAGELYELVAGTVDPHVYRGTVADQAGNLIGDSTFMWEGVNPYNIRAALLKSVLGASPPDSLFVEFHSSDGQYAETKLDRASGSDTGTTYAYHRDPVDSSFDSAPIGSTFSVAFYRDEAKTVPFTIQQSTNRWEPDKRSIQKFTQPLALKNGSVSLELPTETLNAGQVTDADEFMVWDASSQQWTKVTVDAAADKLQERNAAVAVLPVPLLIGRRYLTSAENTVQQDKAFQFLQSQPTLRFLNVSATYVNGLYAYSGGYSGPNASALRNKVFFAPQGTHPGSAKPTTLRYYTERGTVRTYSIAQNAVPGEQHRFEVSGLSYAGAVTGQDFFINVVYSDGSMLYPEQTYAPGEYIATSETTLIFAPGVAASWAAQGQPEPRTLLAVTVLQAAGAGAQGIRVSNSSNNAQNALSGFSPDFDLDDDDKQNGIVEIEASLTLSGRGANTSIGFDSNVHDPLLNVRITGFSLASTLRGTSDYIGSSQQGVKIGEADVRNGSGTLGTVELYLAHDANNDLGYYLNYSGNAGALGFDVLLSISAIFVHNDGGQTGDVPTPDPSYPNVSNTSIPTGTAADTFGAWTEVFRRTETSEKHISLMANMTAQASWTAQGGAERGGVQYRVRQMDEAGSQRRILIPFAAGYVRTGNMGYIEISKYATTPLNTVAKMEAGDYILIEGRGAAQNYVAGQTIDIVGANSNVCIQELE